jgi:hypothetical protein
MYICCHVLQQSTSTRTCLEIPRRRYNSAPERVKIEVKSQKPKLEKGIIDLLKFCMYILNSFSGLVVKLAVAKPP